MFCIQIYIQAQLSRKLVELERNVPLDLMTIPAHFGSISEFRMESLNTDRLLAFYERMGFSDLKRRVENRISFPPRAGVTKNDATATPTTITTPIASNGPSKYYDSIMEEASLKSGNNGNTEPSARSNSDDDDDVGGGGIEFSNSANFSKPPKPDEYNDVPF